MRHCQALAIKNMVDHLAGRQAEPTIVQTTEGYTVSLLNSTHTQAAVVAEPTRLAVFRALEKIGVVVNP